MTSFDLCVQTIEASWERISRPEKVVAALSGGADSVLLLRALNALRGNGITELAAVHVNHGLRANAALDEKFCEELCDSLKVPLKVIRVRVDPNGSVEANARQARYEAFERVREETGVRTVALAHHMNDQTETVMLHLLHGSGLNGLGGMREENRGYWRPLLGVPRKTIREALEELHQPWREDESNDDLHFTRNRIRHELIPEMEKIDPECVGNIARNAALIREENDWLEEYAGHILKGHCGCGNHHFIMKDVLKAADPVIQRRTVRHYLRQFGIEPDSMQTERIRALLELPDGSTENMPLGWKAVSTRSRIHFIPKEPQYTPIGNLKR